MIFVNILSDKFSLDIYIHSVLLMDFLCSCSIPWKLNYTFVLDVLIQIMVSFVTLLALLAYPGIHLSGNIFGFCKRLIGNVWQR